MRDALKQAKFDLAFRQNEIADIRRRANLRNAEDQMTSLTEQLAALQKQLIEAKMEHKDIDNLRANYDKYVIIRDEKQKLMEEMDAHIEKLYALMEDPGISLAEFKRFFEFSRYRRIYIRARTTNVLLSFFPGFQLGGRGGNLIFRSL